MNQNGQNTGEARRTQLSSIKPDIKDLQKVEQCHSSHYIFFVLEKKNSYFSENVSSMQTWNGLAIVILK